LHEFLGSPNPYDKSGVASSVQAHADQDRHDRRRKQEVIERSEVFWTHEPPITQRSTPTQEKSMLRPARMLLFALPFGAIATTTLAAPSVSAPTTLSQFEDSSFREPVAQRCWWHRGVHHCQRYGGYRAYGYSGPYRSDAYRTGSRRWWQEMDREGRGGRGNRP
jgi:hypothetical protein